MLIVNADDWGRSVSETDAALRCHDKRRITSATAMVFMSDSARAAQLALQSGMTVGLHLNLSQPFETSTAASQLKRRQERVAAFVGASKYAILLYNPALRHDFEVTYKAQVDEFCRLYGKPPSHVDGHHHKHLCVNVILDGIIPAGQRMRRNFFFWPGEKGWVNRTYRRVTDRCLARRYRMTDYFFALSQCLQGDRLARVLALARTRSVELMTHPACTSEFECLMSDRYQAELASIETGTYASL